MQKLSTFRDEYDGDFIAHILADSWTDKK